MLLAFRVNRTWIIALSSVVVYFSYITFFRDGVSLLRPAPLPTTDSGPPDPVDKGDSALKPTAVATAAASTAAIGSYHSDYLYHLKGDDRCEALYSSCYLDYLAIHHLPYCESGSRLSFECFRDVYNASFCVGKGVILDHTRAMPKKDTAMDCKFRNFTIEAMESPRKAAELSGVEMVADMKSYFFSTGVMEQLKWWDFNTSAEITDENPLLCDAKNNDHRWILMVKREGNGNVWHKLMEMWQSMITLDVLQIAIDPATQRPYLPPEELPNVQIMFEDDEDQVVDEWWPMLTGGTAPVRKRKSGPARLGNVIVPLAGSSSPFWQHHAEDLDCHEAFLLNAFLRRLYRHIGLEPAKHDEKDTLVTFIDRRGETRKMFNLVGQVERLKKRWPQVTFRVVDFATLSLKEQVFLAHETDVLVGVTGAAMTHIYGSLRNLALWKS